MKRSEAVAKTDVPAIFISHTTRDLRDLNLAHRIARTLRERGAHVWIAPDSIPIGDKWQPQLAAALIQECTHFLVILSAASVQAEWVTKEIGLARERAASERPLKILSLQVGMLQDVPHAEFLSQFQQVPDQTDPDAQAQLVAASVGLGEAAPAVVQAYLAAVREHAAHSSYLALNELGAKRPRGGRYVPLWVELQRGDRDPDGMGSATRDEAGELHGREARGGNTSERRGPTSVADMMSADLNRHILLVGEPGTGKSTLLRRLAERCWDAPETVGLSQRHLPLLVPLRRLAEAEGTISERFRSALVKELALDEPVPAQFIDDWTRQTGAPFLILLDAFDEVPATERPRLANWLDDALALLTGHRVVVAARASSIRADEWEQRFTRYQVPPFTSEQTAAFAQHWFGDAAAGFLDELERLRAPGISSKVLLLTIAARVFVEKQRLPDTRAQLYHECVDLCLEEASQHGFDQELGAELGGPRDLHAARLAGLALRMTEQPREHTLDRVGGFMSDYLIAEEGVAKGRARAWGRHFVEVAARRSGMLVRRDDLYEIFHQTFREFLAASAVASAWAPGTPEANAYVDRWTEFDWFEVVLFLFGVWDDGHKNATRTLEHVLESKEGLRLAGAVLAEGVRVDAAMDARIVEALLGAVRHDWIDRHDRFNPFRVLGRLADRPRVGAGLRALALDDGLDEDRRVAVLGALRSVGDLEHADTIVADLLATRPADFWDSDRSGYLLRKLGDGGLLDAVAENDRVDAGVRLRAATKRVEWSWDYGPPDRAVAVIQHIAGRADADPSVRLEALSAIEKLASKEALAAGLRSVANDTSARATTRILAARRLCDAGAAEEGEAVLLAVALDRFAPPGLRKKAAQDLSMHHWPEDMTPTDASRLIGTRATRGCRA